MALIHRGNNTHCTYKSTTTKSKSNLLLLLIILTTLFHSSFGTATVSIDDIVVDEYSDLIDEVISDDPYVDEDEGIVEGEQEQRQQHKPKSMDDKFTKVKSPLKFNNNAKMKNSNSRQEQPKQEQRQDKVKDKLHKLTQSLNDADVNKRKLKQQQQQKEDKPSPSTMYQQNLTKKQKQTSKAITNILTSFKNKNYYTLLSLYGSPFSILRLKSILRLFNTKYVTLTDVKNSYRNQSRIIHPDKNKHPNAKEAFECVSEAYRVLSDVVLRRGYDRECRRRRFVRYSGYVDSVKSLAENVGFVVGGVVRVVKQGGQVLGGGEKGAVWKIVLTLSPLLVLLI